MTPREFLLQLTNKTSLNLLVRLLLLVRHVDDNGLASTSTVNLLGGGDVKVTKGGLELGGGELELSEFVSDVDLELIRFL
jgi:hypothetical protein